MNELASAFPLDHPLVQVLLAVRKSPILHTCWVFGSMARKVPRPVDLDLLVILPEGGVPDLKGVPHFHALANFLDIGRRWYGYFDPFVWDRRQLWVRDADSAYYIPSRLCPHIRAILAEAVPIEDIWLHYLVREKRGMIVHAGA